MSVGVPESVAEKVLTFPESSMGAHRVTLLLADGRQVGDVTLAWGHDIVRIGSRDITSVSDLDFSLSDVVDVSLALDR